MKPVKGNFLSGLIDYAIDRFPQNMDFVDDDEDDDFNYDEYYDFDDDYSDDPTPNDSKNTLDKNYTNRLK